MFTMRTLAGSILLLSLVSCSQTRRLSSLANRSILQNTDFASAHIGISVFDPAAAKYLYDHQGDRFFVPASNTKLLTCYAAMKYLGDSVPALRYAVEGNTWLIRPTGDPGLLHPDFADQPVLRALAAAGEIAYLPDTRSSFQPLGRGWAWDDYDADYMPERSVMPIYGNTVRFRMQRDSLDLLPRFFYDSTNLSLVNRWSSDRRKSIRFARREAGNIFYAVSRPDSRFPVAGEAIPFTAKADGTMPLFLKLLADTLGKTIRVIDTTDLTGFRTLYSRPTDSLLSIMMHRSDNFYAEQSLLMVSNARLGFMNDGKIIDTLLKTDYAAMPQKPKWVDGSGLSRYNLVSPRDFVWLLTQMKNDFAWERIKAILPTGGTGTLASYYKNYAGRIYAKTGSLSNHLALSGYLLTKKGRTLVFSILVNAEMAPAANIRKGIEHFLTAIIDTY